MNKIYALVLMLTLLFVGNVFALSEYDELCSDKEFGIAVSRWVLNNFTQTYNEEFNSGLEITLVGTPRKLNWTSSELIDGIIFKTSKTNTIDGGYNGTIPKTTVSSDIQYVLFCKQEMEIPEYGLIGIIMMGLFAIFIFKNRGCRKIN